MARWVTLETYDDMQALVPLDSIVSVQPAKNYNGDKTAQVYVRGLSLYVKDANEPHYKMVPTLDVEIIHCKYSVIESLKFLLQVGGEDE